MPRRGSGRGLPNFNFPGLAEDAEAFAKAVFGREYDRLLSMKRKYHPANLFRLNQNLT